jgi:hypothetical protein
MNRKILFLLSFFLLSIQDIALAKSYPPSENAYLEKSFRLPAVNAIDVHGDIDVEIKTGCWGQHIDLAGKRSQVESVRMQVKGSTLWVGALNCCRSHTRPKVYLRLPALAQLAYSGGGADISVNGLSENFPVAMMFQGSPHVELKGNVNLYRLIAGGRSRVFIYWINTCEPCIRAMDDAEICIGGIADTLVIDAYQSARVDARYVRTRRAFVKTYGCSRADICVMKSMNILASGRSNVYYYQDPKFQAPLLQCAGSVIKMTDICYPPCWLCDNACCKNGWH